MSVQHVFNMKNIIQNTEGQVSTVTACAQVGVSRFSFKEFEYYPNLPGHILTHKATVHVPSQPEFIAVSYLIKRVIDDVMIV